MFPYPSGSGLHVGHVESYTATDIYSRFSRFNGYNVLHPQGWDAFGLPAENYAVKTGIHPSKTTKKAIQTYKRQINSMGFSYDWKREVNTSTPDYYKWTQWFFLFLYRNGLSYKKKAKVNWCTKCQTVLANEQSEGGKCERCESPVIQKDLEQWFFKITDFIEDQNYQGKKIKGLLSGLDDVDWPESTKLAQKNWIGRSEGSMVKFKIQDAKSGSKRDIEVYTTRPDTLFGCTYFVLSPEHSIVDELKSNITNWTEVEKYRQETKKKTDLERTDLARDKTGVKLDGVIAVNPVNREKLPVFIADYVLMDYGTGAIMAVPAHDHRDWEFARKFNLEIIPVVMPEDQILLTSPSVEKNKRWDIMVSALETSIEKQGAVICEGISINSSFLNGLKTDQAKKKITAWLKEKKLGRSAVNYKIRDWLVSRQRYWGAPIPIIYCEKCGQVPVPEKDLPVKLPKDVNFMPTGESPLKYSKKFQQAKCPKCESLAKRESDTMDTFVCSSWYYFRYADPKNKKEFAAKKALKKWLPVDVYIGGVEHAVLHLLYSRFFTKALQKYGYTDFNEPFLKLRHQGTILAENGTKMSKSRGTVVNPDEVMAEYGADTLRMYEMFMGPLEDAKPWSTKGIVGISRFLEKVWRLSQKIGKKSDSNLAVLHETIKKVTGDIKLFKFNTAISQLMIFINKLSKEKEIPKAIWGEFLILLSPFAPHIAEELWSGLGNKVSIFKEKWPKYDKKLIEQETYQMIIQINGKVRDKIEVSKDITEKQAKETALNSQKIKKWLGKQKPKKVIYVSNRLINLVV